MNTTSDRDMEKYGLMKRIPDETIKLPSGKIAFMPPTTKCPKCGYVCNSKENNDGGYYSSYVMVECPKCKRWISYPTYTETDIKQMKAIDRFENSLIEYAKTVGKSMTAEELMESIIRYTLSNNDRTYNLGSSGTMDLFELILNIVSYSNKDNLLLKKKGHKLVIDYANKVPNWVKKSLDVKDEWNTWDNE